VPGKSIGEDRRPGARAADDEHRLPHRHHAPHQRFEGKRERLEPPPRPLPVHPNPAGHRTHLLACLPAPAGEDSRREARCGMRHPSFVIRHPSSGRVQGGGGYFSTALAPRPPILGEIAEAPTAAAPAGDRAAWWVLSAMNRTAPTGAILSPW